MMREYIPKEKEQASGFMKALHRAVGSLTDGLDLLVTNAQLLLQMIVWGQDDGTSSLDDTRELWHALGYPDFFVDVIAQLSPRLRDDKIVCDAACRAWEPGKLLDIWLVIRKFRGFSQARFGSVGRCLLALVSSLLVGTEVYAHKILNSVGHCYYLSQFNRLTHDHKVMAVTLCLACRVPEELILAVLADDRIIGRVDEYAAHLSDEHSRLESFSGHVWERLSTVLDGTMDGGVLSSNSRRASHVGRAYIDRLVLLPLREPPFSWANGDIEANLRNSIRAKDLTRPMAIALQRRVALGDDVKPLSLVVLALTLIQCSTNRVEQDHVVRDCLLCARGFLLTTIVKGAATGLVVAQWCTELSRRARCTHVCVVTWT